MKAFITTCFSFLILCFMLIPQMQKSQNANFAKNTKRKKKQIVNVQLPKRTQNKS